jgi:hypothetical protein
VGKAFLKVDNWAEDIKIQWAGLHNHNVLLAFHKYIRNAPASGPLTGTLFLQISVWLTPASHDEMLMKVYFMGLQSTVATWISSWGNFSVSIFHSNYSTTSLPIYKVTWYISRGLLRLLQCRHKLLYYFNFYSHKINLSWRWAPYAIFFFFLLWLGFELRASHLQSRHSTAWATLQFILL